MHKVKTQNKGRVFGLSAVILAVTLAGSQAQAQVSLAKNYAPEDAPNCHDVFNGMSYTTGDQIVCPEAIDGAVEYINNTGAFGTVQHIGYGLLCQMDEVRVEGASPTQIELNQPFMIALSGPEFYIVTPEIEPSFEDDQDLRIERIAQDYIIRNRRDHGLVCGRYLGF